MADPFTSDGNTNLASYEHVRRVAEFNGVPYAGWKEITGGGVTREGMDHYYGAGDEPRGVTNGKAKPQDLSVKVENYTWQSLKTALIVQALANGDTSSTGYMKVPWTLVDQWRAEDPTRPSITRTFTVKIKGEAPETPESGEQFYQVLTLIPVGIPKEEFAT